MRPALRWLVLLALAGCERKPSTATPAVVLDAGAAGPAAATGPAAALPPGIPPGALPPPAREVRSVYPTPAASAKLPPEPLAQRLCQALHALPEARRAACCKGSPGIELTSYCSAALSAAVRSGAVRLVEDEVGACTGAIEASLSACDFVGPFPLPLPPACREVLHGTVAAGAPCRSSLECQGTLRCQGGGPTDVGRCGPPLAAGEQCGMAVDALAAYTRMEQSEARHPECAGACSRLHRCMKPLADGARCLRSSECQTGSRCGDGLCVPGAQGAASATCTGGSDCQEGLRCVQGRCLVPGSSGAACRSDFECRGGCVRAAGASSGLCAPRCDLR